MRPRAALEPLDLRRRQALHRLARIGKREADVIERLLEAVDDQRVPATNSPTKVISRA